MCYRDVTVKLINGRTLNMDRLTFGDLFNKQFMAMQTGAERFNVFDVLIYLTISFLIGLFIYYVYKKTFQGVLYQKSFNVSLVVISIIVTLIIMTISGNLVLSLGMVGALSIVRFRTPIKDPVDLVFIFWAITVGIANGVGYFSVSIIGSIIISIVIIIMKGKTENELPYLLILHYKDQSEIESIKKTIREAVRVFRLQSQTITDDYNEVTGEVRLINENTEFLKLLHENKKILKATLITHSGDLSQV